jgi:NAD(P)-dependent dehydrogenase (short-subunit alcohol dehydrogenase family)
VAPASAAASRGTGSVRRVRAIWERDPDTCAAAADAIGGRGLATDVRDAEAVDAALERTERELGTVSILVNNAGGTFHSPPLETSGERVGCLVPEQPSATCHAPSGWLAAYAAAKAGVINYTKTASFELAPYGIRVNALAPDLTVTEGLRSIGGGETAMGTADGIPMHHDAPRRTCRRDGLCSRVSRIGDGKLHHRSDDPRRRGHGGRGRLIPPSAHRCPKLGPG